MTGSIKQRQGQEQAQEQGQEQGQARDLQTWLSRQFERGEPQERTGFSKFFRWDFAPRYDFITHVGEASMRAPAGFTAASPADLDLRQGETVPSHRKSA